MTPRVPGYFDPVAGGWRTDLLDRFVAPGPWAERLPEVLDPTTAAGEVDEPGRAGSWASRPARWSGRAPGTTWPPRSGPDCGPARSASPSARRARSTRRPSEPTFDPTGTVAGFADATGRFLPLVCTLNATKVTDVFARLLGVGAAELDALALAGRPGAGGVVVVPYLDGERTPNRPDATGEVHGLRSDARREDLARAAYEGVVCGLLDGLDVLLAEVGVRARSHRARRRRGPVAGLPARPRRPVGPPGARAGPPRAGRRRRLRAGRGRAPPAPGRRGAGRVEPADRDGHRARRRTGSGPLVRATYRIALG